jgi:4Fe-4S ferredoxin
MKRGTTIKRTNNEGLEIERKMITRTHALKLNAKRCVGCELCIAVCPQDAIELQRGELQEGKLTRRPTVDINPLKCNFCGECVVVCPVNALALLQDGQPKIPVHEYEVFPVLTRQIAVDADKLPIERAEPSAESCPTDVITVQVKRSKAGKPVKVESVTVDESNCIYCKQCEVVAPEAFKVVHPFEGLVRLERSLCPAGCQACADICPSHALFMQDGQLVLDDQFCLYCGACKNVCPVPEALLVRRHRVRHAPIKSGAWVAAVEKLVSAELAAEELAIKSQARRRSVLNYIPGVPKAE